MYRHISHTYIIVNCFNLINNSVLCIMTICRKASWNCRIIVMQTLKVPGSLLIPPYSRVNSYSFGHSRTSLYAALV